MAQEQKLQLRRVLFRGLPLGENRDFKIRYGRYFGREGLSWQLRFTRQTQMIKISLYGNGMCSLYVSYKMTSLKETRGFILLSYKTGLIIENDFFSSMIPSKLLY